MHNPPVLAGNKDARRADHDLPFSVIGVLVTNSFNLAERSRAAATNDLFLLGFVSPTASTASAGFRNETP